MSNFDSLENVLRRAPRPAAPPELRNRLIQNAPRQNCTASGRSSYASPGLAAWFRRWWPVLLPGAASAACGVALVLQQTELSEIKRSVETLSQATPVAPMEARQPLALDTDDNSTDEQQEIDRLKDQIDALRAEIGQLELLRMDNEQLKAQLAAAGTMLTTEEVAALEKAREKALVITCVNNLKQLGLAAHIWAKDNDDVFAPDIGSMSRQIQTPKILVCPADTNRQPAADWQSFTSANCSYDFLMPNENAYQNPTALLFRCPIHGNIGLSDGSAHTEVLKKSPERVVERDGKLFLENAAPASR